MRRTRVLLLVVAILTVSAGCNGLGGGGSGGGAEAGTSTATATPEPTAYPKSGADLNGTTLRQRHVDTLLGAGSFESYATVRIGDESAGTRFETTARVNRSAGHALSVTRITSVSARSNRSRTVARYTAGNRTAERVVVSVGGQREVRNRSARAPYTDTPVREVNVTSEAGGRFVEFVVAALSWRRTGVERVEGVPATRYNATGVEDRERLATLLGNARNISAVESTIHVDRRGSVRQLRFRADATFQDTPGTYQLVLRFRGLGRTTVTRPPWVADAAAWQDG
jgi:hypothetical protein